MTIHECEFPDDMKQIGSRSRNEKSAQKEIEEYFEANKTLKHIPPQTLSKPLCKLYNEYYPETVCSDPIGDLNVLHDWQTGKRSYSFHSEYPPIAVTNTKGIKSPAPGPTEAIGSIMGGFTGHLLKLEPLVRCVGFFPDFIFQQINPLHYIFVEAKASVAKNAIQELEKQKRKFLQRAVQEFPLEVCNQFMLITTAITPSYPAELECHVYRVWTANSLKLTASNLGLKPIWEQIKPHVENELTNNKTRKSLRGALMDILNNDKEMTNQILEEFGDEIIAETEEIEQYQSAVEDQKSAFENRVRIIELENEHDLEIDINMPLEEQITVVNDNKNYVKIRNRLHEISTIESTEDASQNH